jgi:hypothetical protein
MEYRNSIDTTGVNIPGRMVDYALQLASEGRRGEAAPSDEETAGIAGA